MIVTGNRACGFVAPAASFTTTVHSFAETMPKATVFDVAKLAGVSVKTVSRVVNGEANVRASTRESVEKAIAELDYRPDQTARNLASYRQKRAPLAGGAPNVYTVLS